MATQNAVILTRDLLSYTILTDKKSVIDLLNKNGITLSQNATDSQVSIASLIASSKSPNFKSELIDLLASKTDSAKNTFQNFSGDNDFYGFTGIDDLAFTGSDDFWKNGNGSNVGTNNTKESWSKIIEAAKNKKALEKKNNPNLLIDVNKTTGAKDSKERGAFWKGIGSFLKENILTKDNINQGLRIGLTSIDNKIQSQQNAVQQEALALQEVQDSMQRDLQNKNKPNKLFLIIGVVAGLGIIGYLIFKKK
jgi:hypothetical protein